MELSSKYIHVKPNSPRAFPNVVKFHFSYLRKVRGHRKIIGEPKRCRKCLAILLRNATCSFCYADNIVSEDDDIPQADEIEYIIKLRDTQENERYIVFCLDMSNSMGCGLPIDENTRLATDEQREERKKKELSELIEQMKKQGEDISQEVHNQLNQRDPNGQKYASRMEIIQTAVIECLRDIEYEAENKRVVLVTFNNDISIHFPSGGQIKSFTFPGSLNTNEISEFIRANIDRFRVDYIANNLDVLTDQVLKFENSGQTALGPALYSSVLIASKCPRSSVLVFTDGVANKGQGALENDLGQTRVKADDFYKDITEIAYNHGVSVSIATIKGENSKLSVLKDVSVNTNGRIFTVDPAKLDDIEFEFNQTTSILVTLATNVNLTILVPKGLIIKDSKNEHSNSNILTKKIGNVTKKTEIGFEIAGTSECQNLIDKEIPIQLELSYKSDEGSDVIRVIRIRKNVTEDDKIVEKNADRCILGSYLIRTVANLKTESDEFVSLAFTINDIQTDIVDKFDREKFFREVRNVGIDLGGDYSNNQDSDDDNTIALRNKSLRMTSDDLRKKNI